MILAVIFKKLLLFFAPLVLFYFLRKIGRKNAKKRPNSLNIDKTSVIDGEVVEENK
jgi:hypothetical protein